MKRSNSDSTSSADGKITRSSSRSKDARLGDNFRQPPRTDSSSSSQSKSSDQTTTQSSNNIVTGCVVDRSTTAITSSSSSSLIPFAANQPSSTLEFGIRYNNRLSILTRKSSKSSASTSSIVILAAIEKVLDKTIQGLIRDLCVNVDQKLARKSHHSNLAFTFGNLPTFRKKGSKETKCIHLLSLYDLFVQLSTKYKECGECITSYDMIERAFSPIIAVIDDIDNEADQEIAIRAEKKLGDKQLESIRVDEIEFVRKYMEGEGTTPPVDGYEKCPFCNHCNVDSPPYNIEVEKNRKKEIQRYNRQSNHLQQYNDRSKKNPPKDSNGKELKKIPAPKVEKIRLRCHCHQMRAIIPGHDDQSTCPIKCVNQETGLRYENNTCVQCNCKCFKTYHMQDVPIIVAKLAQTKLEKKDSVARGGGAGFLSILENAYKVGQMSKQQAETMLSDKDSELSRTISTSRQVDYTTEIENISTARHLISNKPDYEARQYFTNTIMPSVLPKPEQPSIIIDENGMEVDLRTNKRTTAANFRSRNNGLGMTASDITKIASTDGGTASAIDLTETKTSPDSSIEITRVSVGKNTCTNLDDDDDSSIEMTEVSKGKCTSTKLDDERVTRMKKHASKKLHVTKRFKNMTDEEKEDRSAAQRTEKLYDKILANGTSATEIVSLQNGLGDDDNVSFCSEKYNDAYMNMYGYVEE